MSGLLANICEKPNYYETPREIETFIQSVYLKIQDLNTQYLKNYFLEQKPFSSSVRCPALLWLSQSIRMLWIDINITSSSTKQTMLQPLEFWYFWSSGALSGWLFCRTAFTASISFQMSMNVWLEYVSGKAVLVGNKYRKSLCDLFHICISPTKG